MLPRSTRQNEIPSVLAFHRGGDSRAAEYKVTGKIKIGGAGRWDYVYVDSANHRLYVSHGTQTEVIDTATEKVVGTIRIPDGVHGIAIANDLGRGFTSDGMDNDVTIFDLKTLKVLGKVKTGTNPDAIIYEPVIASRIHFQWPKQRFDRVRRQNRRRLSRLRFPWEASPNSPRWMAKATSISIIEDKNEIGEIDAKYGHGDEALLDRPLRRPERPRDQSEEQLPLFGLREQDDDCQRSRRGQSHRDARDRPGPRRRRFR